jgi:hypothetical protein
VAEVKMSNDRFVLWISQNWFKAICAASVLIVSGGVVGYLNDQSSLAREVEADRRKQQEVVRQDGLARDKKEFSLKRRGECLNIFKAENAKWNNVRGWTYDEDADVCFIRYRNNTRKTTEDCNDLWPLARLDERFACLEGEFLSRF